MQLSIVKRLIPWFIVFLGSSWVGHTDGRETAGTRPTIYNHVTKRSDPVVERIIKTKYGEKFHIVDFTAAKAFLRSKCTRHIAPKPQRDASFHLLTGTVRVLFIVTLEGKVREPFILGSTNRSLDATVLATIKEWRGTPARLNGSPIAIVMSQDFVFSRY